MFLADAAPSGSGLAIVGIILLVFLAICLAVFVLVVRFILRRIRGKKEEGPPPAPPRPPEEQNLPGAPD